MRGHSIKAPGRGISLEAYRFALLKTVAVFGLALATALSAHVRLPLPFTPVPLTLQTFFVLLSGALLGAGAGAASQVGALGLLLASPQLLAASAPGGLLGPTGGYLLSFVPAAWLVGHLSGKEGSWARMLAAMVAATLMIYFFGVLQLGLVAGLSAGAALKAGVLPFVPADVLKLAAAAVCARTIKKGK
ncbi:MAG: biotin transporter BioY [Pseudomonadota bacterium]